jgi:AraC-like DNA-binding protein
MLSVRSLLSEDGVEVADVVCTHGRGRGRESEQVATHALVFVRRGCFVRSADGAQTLLDPTLAYFMDPRQEQRYDHPHDGGDVCTSLVLDAQLLASLWGGDPRLPHAPLPVAPEFDLEHRLLLAGARAGADRHALVERTIALTAGMLERVDVERVASGRPATVRARRALADGVRELLVDRSSRSLRELAQLLAVSPHHLSRVFREITGETISRHRMRLRARGALERISAGERDLAGIAADLGFVDQSHLCRVLVAETGTTPSGLRTMLA